MMVFADFTIFSRVSAKDAELTLKQRISASSFGHSDISVLKLKSSTDF
jgi:hypothetical protein